MPTEAAFLAAIAAQPDDLTVRQVYADWLEERSQELAHLRAETIRIETQAQALPVFSEHFWRLKSRRAELRARRDAGWLAAMGYTDRYRLCFDHGVPRGWKQRWRLIRAFTECWLGRPMPDIGGRREEVERAERHLGRPLSAAVREWVAFAADVAVEGYPTHLFYTQSGFNIDLGRVPVLDGYTIAQLDCDAGTFHQCVREADAHYPDPSLTMVTSHVNEMEEPPLREYVVGPTNLSDTGGLGDRVTTFALGQALEWLRGHRAFFGHVPDPEGDVLLPRMRDEFPVCFRFQDKEVFEAPELLVEVVPATYPGPGWRVHARVRRPSRAVRGAVPPAFWEFLTATAQREWRGHWSSTTDAHGFRAAFNRGAGRRSTRRVIHVDR